MRSAGVVAWCAALLAVDASIAQLPSGTWQYEWGDEFSGESVDTTKWNIASPGWTMPNSLSTATASKVSVGNGALTLDATRTGTSGSVQFQSGSVSTYQKQNFNGGYIEARIQLPSTPGSWPAFWGLYDGWPPEMDIMEYPLDTAAGSGYAPDEYHTAFHYTNPSGGNSAGAGKVNPGNAGDMRGNYYTFGARWVDDTSVTFYLDGQQVSSFNNATEVAEMNHMYLIFGYAVGGWPGTPNTTEWPVGFTDQTKVDWVRVWKNTSAKTSNWAYSGSSSSVTWDAAGNWTNGAPNLGGVTSSFSTVTPPQQNIDWSGRRTLTTINLDGATRYQFGGVGDRLVLGYGNNGSQRATINVAATTTTEHEVRADLEFAGGLDLINNSAHPLLLTGRVIGGGGIRINGTGVVSFAGDGSYSGDTLIGVGTGPGVARARGVNSLGVGGTVVIGDAGNSTTARLELENNSQVSNAITMRGRNNATAAIVNNSGDNTLSGAISLEVGGSTYAIRSDSGHLNLSGKSHPAGVAVRANASGSRILRLEGAGDGAISGVIENGTGVVSVVKAGAGVWRLSGANTYSGPTQVTAGTLVVDGATGYGAATVSSGATLEGRGMVRGGLTAQSGSTVRVGGEGLSLELPGGHQLIDDFNQYPAGQIGATPNTTGGVWTGVFDGTANAEIANNAGDRALRVRGINQPTGSWRGAVTDLGADYDDDFSLDHGGTGTYFFRVRRNGAREIDAVFGLSDLAATAAPGTDNNSPWDEFAAMLSIFGDTDSSVLRAYSQGVGDVNIAPAGNEQWLNVWLSVNNAAKTYQVATSTGSADGTDSGGVYQFGRRTAGAVGSNPLVTFGIHESRNVGVELDDLYFVDGVNLVNPLFRTPEMVGETLNVVGAFNLAAGSTLAIDLGQHVHDTVEVTGSAVLDGVLSVTLDPGAAPALNDAFTVLTAASITGNLTLGGPDGAKFSLARSTPGALVLTAVSGLPGDYNNDGAVDAADYTVWRDNADAPAGVLLNDFHGGPIGADQYSTWKNNFGVSLPDAVLSAVVVTEPSSAGLLLLGVLGVVCGRRARAVQEKR